MCIRDRDMDEAIEAANEIAPEHMEIVTANPFEDMMKVKNAGAIFIGAVSYTHLWKPIPRRSSVKTVIK